LASFYLIFVSNSKSLFNGSAIITGRNLRYGIL